MEIPFADCCARVQHHIEQAYCLRVVTRDIPDPLTGDLDGIEIQIDYAVTPEQRLFLLAHLFGHTVQWNVNPDAFELGRQYRPPVEERLFPDSSRQPLQTHGWSYVLQRPSGVQNPPFFNSFSAAHRCKCVRAIESLRFMERAMGIEPTSEAWEASILPLYDARSLLQLIDYTQLSDCEYRSEKDATGGRKSFLAVSREGFGSEAQMKMINGSKFGDSRELGTGNMCKRGFSFPL
jgi:hypothetical protein